MFVHSLSRNPQGRINVIKCLSRMLFRHIKQQNSNASQGYCIKTREMCKSPANPGADVNYEMRGTGQSVLIAVVSYGNLEIVKVLIETGADVNRICVNGNIPSIQATVNKHAGCVKMSIYTGADVKPDDHYTTTSLIEATKNGHIECVKL